MDQPEVDVLLGLFLGEGLEEVAAAHPLVEGLEDRVAKQLDDRRMGKEDKLDRVEAVDIVVGEHAHLAEGGGRVVLNFVKEDGEDLLAVGVVVHQPQKTAPATRLRCRPGARGRAG